MRTRHGTQEARVWGAEGEVGGGAGGRRRGRVNARPAGVSGSGGRVRRGRPAPARPRGAPDGVGAGGVDQPAAQSPRPSCKHYPTGSLQTETSHPAPTFGWGCSSSGRAAGGRCPAFTTGQVRPGSPQTNLTTQDTGSGRVAAPRVQASAGAAGSPRELCHLGRLAPAQVASPGRRRRPGTGLAPSSWVGMLDARWLYFCKFQKQYMEYTANCTRGLNTSLGSCSTSQFGFNLISVLGRIAKCCSQMSAASE